MKTVLFAAVIAALAGSSSAAPNPPGACKASGDPIVTIAHGGVAGPKQPSSSTKLYASGAWTFAETLPEGKPGRTANGCLAKDQLAAIDAAIKANPWTITHPQIHCMAVAATFIDYTVGKTKFTQKLCGTDILDDKSTAALAEITKMLDAATAPPKT